MDNDILRQIWTTFKELSQEVPFNSNDIEPHFAHNTDDNVPIRKLFIGNLAERTTNKDLEKLFSAYGKIETCYVKRVDGRSHFGFITYSDVESTVQARRAAHRMEIKLHARVLRVTAADSWHQPDSIENRKRFSAKKQNKNDIETAVAEVAELESNNDSDSPINKLNDDCLIEVFLYLPIADRIRMERVCKRWQALSQESWHSVKYLNLSKKSWGLSPKIRVQVVDTSTLRKVLVRCGKFLTHLDLSQVSHLLSSSTLTIIGKLCPNIQFLNITGLSLSPSGINSLMTNCRNITKFMMKTLTGPCERELSQLFSANKKLKYILIDGDEYMCGKSFSSLPHDVVEDLHLIRCTALLSNYFDVGINHLTNLKSLTLDVCVCLTDSTLEVVGKKTTITNLEFRGMHPLISSSSLNHLVNLMNLQRLCLNDNIVVNDDFLINLSYNCKQLNYLDLTSCHLVTNRGINSLITLIKLETLIINFVTKVDDDAIANFQSLKVFKCWGCKNVTDVSIINLINNAPHLIYLDLSATAITCESLHTAVAVTKKRKNNCVLKMIIGGTFTHSSEVKEISPLLQIVNLDLSVLDNNTKKYEYLSFN
ncbi:F-box/LRR-repeat protein 2 [Microplitis demolitor]|uniref:F-box/LRR-repeat protein 2 n=1 Tax=Microplitis demolitor TaxID=69319 RepID=UPI00235B704D|nr:F-box/LRR-repeat protein 2 [Microplitis demolitor]